MAMFRTAQDALVHHDDTFLIVESAPHTGFALFFEPGRTYRGQTEARQWFGHESRRDELGRRWQRQIDRLVVDDFGSLVEVPA